MLTVIVPAYNEAEMVPLAAKEIVSVLACADIPFELLFVDDGSGDGTWEAIGSAKELLGDDSVKGIRFSRNFGKEAAIAAGLESAQGDCCVVIDCDLQHPPEAIVEMYRLWQDGYEVVEGVKSDRGPEGAFHGALAGSFYGLISKAMGMDLTDSSDFKLLDRKVIDAVNAMPERGVFFRALSYWVGFKKGEVPYKVRERQAGESKWSGWSLTKYALKNITSFSSAPMQIVTVLGVIALVVAVIFGAVSLVQWFMGEAIGGFTTVILLLLFMSSLIMISLGVIGYYIARIYDEVQGRPRFIVAETLEGERTA